MSDNILTKDVGRIELLIEVADDCIGYANELLNQAPNMGRSKEQSYRREAAAVEARAKELREWADELRAEQDEPSAPQITHWRATGDCGCFGTVTGELKLGGRCMHGNQWLPRAHGWQSVPEGGGRFWPDPSQPVGWGLNLETIRRFPPEDAPGLAFACTGCGATISVAFTDASKKFVDAKSLEGWTVHLGCTWCPKCNAQNRQTEPKAPLACACIGCARKPKHGECECGMNCNCRCKLGPLSENRSPSQE